MFAKIKPYLHSMPREHHLPNVTRLGKDLLTLCKRVNKPFSPLRKVGKVIENHLLYIK